MTKKLWILFPITILFACLPGFSHSQIDLERLAHRPKHLYDKYKINPVQEAIKRRPRFFSDTVEVKYEVDGVQGLFLPYADPSIVNNTDCNEDVNSLLRVYSDHSLLTPSLQKLIIDEGHYWPWKIPDSWGKLGDGILNGNSLLWGLMEECVKIKVDEHFEQKNFDAHFKGKYCLSHFRRKDASAFYEAPPGLSLEEKAFWYIDTSPEFIYFGTCMPDSCTTEDMQVSLEYSLQNSSAIEFVDILCQTEDRLEGDVTGGDIAFEVIVGTIWCLAVGAAFVEFLINWAKQPDLKKGPLKYWLALSSYRSMSKIFKIVNKTNPDFIDCLHGMRALSMIWVTWCHSYSLLLKVTENLKGLDLLTSTAMSQIIFNGSFSADTFFFISGLLATYSVLREHEVTGKVNWIMYYVHRILRLMPAIALTCFMMATVGRYALAGPYGAYIDRDILQSCRNYWYMDVLFASNFASEGYSCLPQSWYTSVDFQLYFILPLVLVPLILKRNIGLGVLGLFTAASFIVPTTIAGVYNLKPYLPFAVPDFEPEVLSLNNDYMPWSRASPYFIGVCAGWLLFTNKNKKVTLPWWLIAIGWALSITTSLLVLLGMAPYNTVVDPTKLSLGMSTVYCGFSRGAWALSLAWVVFACQKGFGGPVNTFLSHACFHPFSRLAYAMFLITVPVQLLSAGALYIPSYMDHINKFIDTCGYLFISTLVGMGLAMTSEYPILALVKTIFPRPGRNVEDEPPKES